MPFNFNFFILICLYWCLYYRVAAFPYPVFTEGRQLIVPGTISWWRIGPVIVHISLMDYFQQIHVMTNVEKNKKEVLPKQDYKGVK